MIRNYSGMLCAAMLVVAMSAPAFAGSPAVGQDAPELSGQGWVLNPPDVSKLSELRGEIVLVEKWGVRCPPCVGLIPHLVELQKTYGGKGLHIFAFEAQNHTPDQIKALMVPKGVNYPVSTNGANNYDTGGGVPHAWLIGPDGKVLWEGNPAGARGVMDKMIEDEVKKVKYPGLGRATISKALDKAANYFKTKDWAKARAEAKKVAASSSADETTKADAEYVAERATKLAAGWMAQAAAQEKDRRYLAAKRIYAAIAAQFKGEEEGNAAAAKVKEIDGNKDIKKDIDAAEAFEKLEAAAKNMSPEQRKATLAAFAKKWDGTKAAEDAASAAK